MNRAVGPISDAYQAAYVSCADSALCSADLGFSACVEAQMAYGAGYNILLMGDAVAALAVTNCANRCDPLTYGVCVALSACPSSGGDFCADGGFCAPTTGS